MAKLTKHDKKSIEKSMAVGRARSGMEQTSGCFCG